MPVISDSWAWVRCFALRRDGFRKKGEGQLFHLSTSQKDIINRTSDAGKIKFSNILTYTRYKCNRFR